MRLEPRRSGVAGLCLPVVMVAGVGACGMLLTWRGAAVFDAPLLLWFRDAADTGRLAGPVWMAPLWQALTWLGNAAPRVAVASATVACLLALRHWRSAVWLGSLLLGGLAVSTVLKQWVARPRPQLVVHLDHVNSMSFPSGHALNSTLFYLSVALLLACLTTRRGARWCLVAAAAALSFAIGVSRIALGVHYPTDVIAGWVAALAWLWLGWMLALRYWPGALPRSAGAA